MSPDMVNNFKDAGLCIDLDISLESIYYIGWDVHKKTIIYMDGVIPNLQLNQDGVLGICEHFYLLLTLSKKSTCQYIVCDLQ